MKLSSLILTGAVTLLLPALSQAQTVIRVTGSSAYRNSTLAAIAKVYDSGFTLGYTGTAISGGSSPNGTSAIFKGNVTLNGTSTPVIVKTTFTGSEAGIQATSAQTTVKFLPTTVPTSAGTSGAANTTAALPTGGTGGAPDPTSSSAAAADVSAEVPDLALSDTLQATSAFKGVFRGVTYPNLAESPNSPVGVVPFQFVVGNGAPSNITNITTQQAQYLFQAGRIPLSFFTGNTADTLNVIATGRDIDSGTRLSALAETVLGPLATVRQYQPTDANGAQVTASSGTVVRAVAFPASTVNGIPVAAFNNGYGSGGRLAGGLAASNTAASLQIFDSPTPTGGTADATGGFFLTYASTGDASAAAATGGRTLSYNGVTYSATAVNEGNYTFWSYEHLYYRAGTTGTVKSFADRLALQIQSTDATLNLNNLKVRRGASNGDGVTVTAK